MQVASESFLAIALPIDKEATGPGYIEILNWNASTKQLQPFQSIQPPTIPAAISGIVTQGDVGLLAYSLFGSGDDDLELNMQTHVAFYNTSSGQFDEFQIINSFASIDLQFFQVGSETFLVLTEKATPWPPVGDDDNVLPVKVEIGIYVWNPSSFTLEHMQSIFIANNTFIGCTGVDVASSSYLVCTTTQTVSDYNFAYSNVYLWDSTIRQFEYFENFLTPAFAEKFHTFTTNGNTYLVTPFIGDNDYNFTEVYEWKPKANTTTATTSTTIATTTHKHTTSTTHTTHKHTTTATTTTPVPSASWVLTEGSCTATCANSSQTCNLAALQAVTLDNILAVSQSLSVTCFSASPAMAAYAPGFLFTQGACQFAISSIPATCDAVPPSNFLRYCCCDPNGCVL
eukprot:m.638927 g.638927  ORF g.638927 m.638927 type:complete len:399 (+) comp58331_c0_seq9:757-1953(+)